MGGARAAVTIVDAHIHLWDPSRFSLSWFRDDLHLPPTVSPEDFRAASLPLVEAAERDETPVPLVERAERDETPRADPVPGPVATAIAVQAGDTLPEMTWLRELAAVDPVVRAVVLQYVPATEGRAGLATSVLNDQVRGIRVATPGGAPDLSDVPGLDALCAGAGESGRVVEFLVRPAQLEAVAALAARHPATTFVLCHLGLGAAEPTPQWEAALRRVAAEPRTAAKFSGLATAPGDHARLSALAATASGAFGESRLLFGSDWPMSARIASHARLVDDVAAAWGARADGFWGATATELYRL
ncbi:L-fuconolactonase [Microbacterium kyungheense]|uniref:L-fuconolactonase n=1 Tax=Microbacterium kyungheense TaxID=1263636 RepID=A0A543EFQ7_9MICO|nr:L-fuconolactonase [Microbacterium kyungheense]